VGTLALTQPTLPLPLLTLALASAQALLRKLGGGLEDLLPGGGGGGAHGQLREILAGLRATGDDSAQMAALTNLCELLSMSTEEALACVPRARDACMHAAIACCAAAAQLRVCVR
jgi:E3 ubiquitin-protein ligase TRIP12